MKLLTELVLRHVGQAAVVLGGGESLPEQMKRVPAGAVLLSANQHGCLLTKCDYMVVCDDKTRPTFKNLEGKLFALRELGVPVISPRRTMADYLIERRLPVNNSGAVAAWAAWIMGCAPILLAGMDCYVGATYWHDAKGRSTGRCVPQSTHLTKWRMLELETPGAMLRTLGGPLATLFPSYDPAEVVTAWPARETVLRRASPPVARPKRAA